MKHQLNDIVWMLVGCKVEWHQQEIPYKVQLCVGVQDP